MSWRPGRSGSFRRAGLNLDTGFRLTAGSRSDDESSSGSKPSSSSSFLRIRPSSRDKAHSSNMGEREGNWANILNDTKYVQQ